MNKEFAVILALFMALITASSNILLKKGFYKIHPFVATYFSVIISTVFLWIATVLFVPRTFFYNYKGILIFTMIGLFAPTIVRTLTYYGIDRLGAARAAPLRAMTPFFAIIMAIFFLKESPSPIIFLGIFLIVSGITFLMNKKEKKMHNFKFVHFFYPLGAAILAGVAANMRKFGLNLMPQAIFASTIAATSSSIVLTVYLFFRYDRRQLVINIFHKNELRFIIIAALLTSCGEIVDLSSLLYGKVSLVVPIFATTPLMIVILSKIFLKKQEVVTKRIFLATIIIVCGVYLIIKSA